MGKRSSQWNNWKKTLRQSFEGLQKVLVYQNRLQLKERDEREEELSAAIERKSKKRKQQDEHLGLKMVGKTILHKWIDNGTEKWYTGKVI